MVLERFASLNLVLVPALLIGGYLYGGSLPLLLYALGIAYVTFAVLISVAWGLSRLETDS